MKTPASSTGAASGRISRFTVQVLLAVLLLLHGRVGAAAEARPNIVFILADDLGWGDLGCYGQRKIRTPNIDRLAAEGMRFTDCYAGAPVCGPSRSVLMTGQHAGHTRVRGNGALTGGIVVGRARRMHLTDDDVTVGQVLQRAGYHTGLIGKWHLEGYNPEAIPLRRGFDEFYGWQMWQMDTHEPTYYPAKRFFNREVRPLPENADGKRGLYETDLVFRQAGEFIRRNQRSPFFLFVSPTAPHDPLVAPDDGPYAGEAWPQPAKTYAAMMHHLDRVVGELMHTLAATGLDQRTVVFFASDNGPRSSPAPVLTEVAEFFDSNGPLRGYKRDLYEGGLRVPMIVRWPGRIQAGAVNGTPWGFADVMATLADLAGGKPAPGTDGLSLAPVLLGRAENVGERFLYWEFFERGFEQAVRWGRWKAVRHAPGQALELFDLAVDAGETTNLAPRQPEVIARIEAYLKTARTESAEWPLHLVRSPAPR
jgi:arylsulfatase A-like enzyme